MRKLTKKNLAELAELMPRISEIEKRFIVGGGSGTKEDPFTVEEFDSMCDKDTWKGGWVAGQGFVAGQVSVVASGTSDSSGSDSGTWDGLFPDAGTIPSGYWNTPDTTGNLPSGDLSGGMWVSGVWVPNSDANNGTTGDGGSTSVGGISGSINLSNLQYLLTNISSTSAFFKQIIDILESNSTINNILDRFAPGCSVITFTVGNFEDPTTVARTHINKDGTFLITLNKKYIDEEGWKLKFLSADNIGYAWSKVKNGFEGLIVTIAHEAIHANYYAIFKEAMRASGDRETEAVKWLVKKGYSMEFVSIFFREAEAGTWYGIPEDDLDGRMHDYMRLHDLKTIEKAVEESRNK